MNSSQAILENQKKFEEEIIYFLKKEHEQTKRILNKIKPADEFVEKEKIKLVKKFKKLQYNKFIEKLFFMHPQRHKVFYAWWDEESEEVNILQYDKR